jgi:PST family polysaccharide transporter
VRLKKLLAVASFASASPFIEYGVRFGRTIVLSRMLLPVEFGVAVAITVLVTIAELISDIGLDRFLLSRARSEDRAVLAAVHLLQALRGLCLAAVIFAAGPWIAAFLDAPQHAGSFRCVAAIVLIRSFAHFEVKQILRDFRFGPDAIVNVIRNVLGFAAIFPAALWLQDHRAIIASLILESLVFVAACRSP